MGTPLLRRKEAGQSIVLIALVIAVLVGLAGLSVDVGEAYAAQRAAQRAVNSAAIKGVDSLIRGRADQTIYKDMMDTLRANGIDIVERGAEAGPGETRMSASYLNDEGDKIGEVGDMPGSTFNGAKISYIHVELKGTTETALARLFGTDTLPVVVETYGGKSPCINGIYPYAVQNRSFSGEPANPDFAGEYTTKDGKYKEIPWRRIYGKDHEPSGGFGWLRWMEGKGSTGANAGSAKQMAADLYGAGTINLGFEEAPWEPGTSAGDEPEGYPISKGYINSHDWVWGSTGDNFSSNDVDKNLKFHQLQGTEMLLPMYDVATGNGANAKYHITAIGRFLLLNYGREGGKSFLDLAYLGESNGCATLLNPRVETPPQVNLVGQVVVKPRHIDTAQQRGPVDIVLVIDESYSMQWAWDEKAKVTSGNPSRMTVTKNTAIDFVNSFMEENDRMAVVTYGRNGGNTGQVMPYPEDKSFSQSSIDSAVSSITDVKADWTLGTTEGKTALVSAINKASVQGNTPTYQGLVRAKNVLGSARSTATVNGQSLPVSQVVVLLTDGVANTYPDGKFDRCPDGSNKSESCVPHLASRGQPIWHVGELAQQMKTNNSKLKIYVIAMGALFDTVGLDRVASEPAPPYFNRADSLNDMKGIFDTIKGEIRDSDCIPGEEAYVSPIDVGRLADDQSIGTVKLIDSSTKAVVAQGAIFEQNGAAWYQFADVKPGTYEIEGFVRYRGKDGELRAYTFVGNGSAVSGPSLSYTLNPEGTLGSTVNGPQLHFDLPTGVCEK
jgi:Mg-chelatase subunit ChlD